MKARVHNTEISGSQPDGGAVHRVALVTNIPTPYRVPLFNILSERLAREGWDLRVFFCAQTYRRRTWSDPLVEARFDYEVLRSAILQRGERAVIMPIGLPRRLHCYRPDAIVVGGMSLAAVAVCLFARVRATPYILWSGEIGASASSRGWIRRRLRGVLSRGAAAFVVYGTAAGEYASSLAPEVPVFPAWNTVDLEHFRSDAMARQIYPCQKDPVPEGSDRAVHVLAVGYLYARKGLDLLIRAMARVRMSASRVAVLDVVGDGPERERLEALVSELSLDGFVHFWGDQPKAELPAFYTNADIFAFPTLFDVWGLVLVEAMASGLPVVASRYAGATVDLVKDDVSGLVVDPRDVEELASAIARLVDDELLRTALGAEGAAFVLERLTLERSADGFVQAIEAAS